MRTDVRAFPLAAPVGALTLLGTLVVTLLGGCVTAADTLRVDLDLDDPALATHSAPTPVVAASAAPAAPSPCGQPIPGWRAFTKSGRMVLFGEQYGTQEIPVFVGDAACQTATLGLPVHVALEVPRFEQPLLDAFLASAGTPEDRQKLLGGGMWNRMYEDGRSSLAIATLIDRVRVLRQKGMAISVHYFDDVIDEAHEVRAARNLIELYRQAPGDVYLVLTGNVHARTVPGAPFYKDFTPMGFHLANALPDVIALDSYIPGGEAWECYPAKWGRRIRCGELPLAPPVKKLRAQDIPKTADGKPVERFAGVWGRPSPEGFHGVFFVGASTASLPARQQLAAR